MASPEQKKSYQVIKEFKGVDTKANRTAIDETEFAWLENAMPIGHSNLKIVPTTSNINVSFTNSVVSFFTANIGLKDYLLAFESDGSAEYVDLTNNTKHTLAAAGTFTTTGDIQVTQWKNERALIADPNKGLFWWDAKSLVNIGSVSLIGLVSGGNNYSSAPFVQISAPNQANGVQATAICTITTGSGSVAAVSMTNVGAGYTSLPVVTFSAPPAPGVTATGNAILSGGTIVGVTITNGGSGYTSAPSVTFTGGGYTTLATANTTIDLGIVNSVVVTEAGSGYTSQPTITFVGGGGSGANAVAGITSFATGTLALLVQNGGTGYTNSANTVVTISGGGGTNATAQAIVSGGQITEFIMTNPGSGYTNVANTTVTITGGGGTNASAQVVISTDTTSGVATFSGRAWVSQGRTVYYSAAGSYSDFTSVSAGSVVLADATLHGNVNQLLSANNFLYIFGDDSINVFSDVRVTSTGTTLFTNTNISASVGTMLPYAIFPYFRSILFMNNYGVYALVGSTTTKVSDALDGIIQYIDFTKPVYAGQVLLNNILCAAFNFYYTGGQGVSTTSRYIQAVFFDKKWFFTSQGNDIKFIVSVPINGIAEIYGTNGTNLVRFYGDNATNIASYVQTALMSLGDPTRTKQALKFGVEATNNAGGVIDVTVDSEYAASPTYSLSNQVNWVNNQNTIIPWTNVYSNNVGWLQGYAYYLYKSDAMQWGKYLGLTVQTNSYNMTINTFEFEHEMRTRF